MRHASHVGMAGLLALTLMAGPVAAQGMGHGWMMGPGMMRGMGAGLCNPGAAGFSAWRTSEIERLVRPTDTQKASFDAFKDASEKAVQIMRDACPRDFPTSALDRLNLMEKRVGAMTEAIKTVKPAFEAFYSSLTDDQKHRLDRVGPGRWNWRNWM
jgi:hypothetical protein